MIRARYNVLADPPFQRSKYTCFDKHTFERMHYVMDIHSNYVKKPRRNPKQPDPGVHDEPKQHEPERQPEKVPMAPTQGALAPLLLYQILSLSFWMS